MKSSHLIKDQQVIITAGRWENMHARIVDPQTIPDGQPHARCCTVEVLGVNPDGTGVTDYVLPRYMERRTFAAVEGTSMSSTSTSTVEEAPMATPLDVAALIASPTEITDPMDPRLDRWRPDPSVVQRYISRKVHGMRDVDLLLAMRRSMRTPEGFAANIGLVGETQSGKTMLVQVLAVLAAQEDGLPKPYPVFTLSGSTGVSSYDLFGQSAAITVPEGERIVWMEGIVSLASRCGGILYTDEINAMAPSQVTALHSITDDRRTFVNYQKAVPNGLGGFEPDVVQAQKSLWIIATINPSEYRGTQGLPEAFRNRFTWFPWDYDEDVEKRLIPSPTVRLLGQSVRSAREARTLQTPVGTSALMRFNEQVALFGVKIATHSFMGNFNPTERDKVQAILDDRGITDLLEQEYPNPTYGSSIEAATIPTTDTEPF